MSAEDPSYRHQAVKKPSGDTEIIRKSDGKVLITVSRELAGREEDLTVDILLWQLDNDEFVKAVRERNPLPPPTAIELEQMQSKLYYERLDRLRNLMRFLEPENQHERYAGHSTRHRYVIGAAARVLLLSIYGSRERAIQDWFEAATLAEGVDTVRKPKQ